MHEHSAHQILRLKKNTRQSFTSGWLVTSGSTSSIGTRLFLLNADMVSSNHISCTWQRSVIRAMWRSLWLGTKMLDTLERTCGGSICKPWFAEFWITNLRKVYLTNRFLLRGCSGRTFLPSASRDGPLHHKPCYISSEGDWVTIVELSSVGVLSRFARNDNRRLQEPARSHPLTKLPPECWNNLHWGTRNFAQHKKVNALHEGCSERTCTANLVGIWEIVTFQSDFFQEKDTWRDLHHT